MEGEEEIEVRGRGGGGGGVGSAAAAVAAIAAAAVKPTELMQSVGRSSAATDHRPTACLPLPPRQGYVSADNHIAPAGSTTTTQNMQNTNQYAVE